MLRPYQQDAHDEIIKWVKKLKEPCLIEAATGCHEAGHPILMADGRVRPVEDIRVGDRLAGPDGSARTVLHLHRGRDQMMRVVPTKGEAFRVNAGHILSVKMTPQRSGQSHKIEEIVAGYWGIQSKTTKHCAKLYRSGAIEFEGSYYLPLDPWTLGVLIGDGCLIGGTPRFCSPDQELIDWMTVVVNSIGLEVRSKTYERTAQDYRIADPSASKISKNRLASILMLLVLLKKPSGEKFIPDIYKRSSINCRLEMIAGLIDTDGHLSRNGYDWISKSRRLADDMVFLCRSVGLAAYMKPCVKGCQNGFSAEYFRVSISGNTDIIPCRISRKRALPRRIKKDCTVTGFRVEADNHDSYYGFEVDGDHLYLDGNFMVHHNSGKSHIIAAVAQSIHEISGGKHVLCLAPSSELVEQNREKYLATGNPASVFSASAGEKCLQHPIVFGTPLTVKNSIDQFGGEFAMVVLDECHGITPTIRNIISTMRSQNPNLRVVGLSATPYRLGTGYIFEQWPSGVMVNEAETKDPYFKRLVYQITAPSLIKQGFLTPPVVGGSDEHYDTLGMKLNGMGQFDAADIDRAYSGQDRKTAKIISDIVVQSSQREGVLIFAATVKHAHECLASLPPELSAIVTGDTPKPERRELLRRFKAREIKYLVNVAVLTTGFDAPHVDVIAMLRPTESVGLMQQIIGRGLRLCEGKTDCLILDYAQNIERHCPDGDVFDPSIKVIGSSAGERDFKVHCPECGFQNEFSARKNEEGFPVDKNGYFTDLDGNLVQTEYGPMPAHHSRRCEATWPEGGQLVRCGYRWTFKSCPECNAENDIAARRCHACKVELVDPNEKLRLDFKKFKRDPRKIQCDRVIAWETIPSVSRSGLPMTRINVTTEYRSFSFWIMKEPKWKSAISARKMFYDLNGQNPDTITYRKSDNGFYNVLAYNREPDEISAGDSRFWGQTVSRPMPKRVP